MERVYWCPKTAQKRSEVAACNISKCRYVPLFLSTPSPSSAPTVTVPFGTIVPLGTAGTAGIAVAAVPLGTAGTSAAVPLGTAGAAVPVASATASMPPIDRPRIFIWYQKDCVACQNSRPVFDNLPRAAPGYAVQEVEATKEMLQRYPHVQVVPLYDIVVPEQGSESPYGPDTKLTTVRNDLVALREQFPTLLASVPAPAPAS